MQSWVPNNCFHQAFDNQNELMASSPLSHQTVWRSGCANNGSSSSSHQSWKVCGGPNYFANELAASNSNEDITELASSSAELSSPLSDTTFYRSLIGGSQTKSRFRPAYPQCRPTESQSNYLQDRSMWSDPASVRTPLEFVPSQRGPVCWNQKTHAAIKNFPSSPIPASAGVQPGTPSSLASWATPPLPNHKRWPLSEQLPGQSDSRAVFVSRPTENCWNNCPSAKYQQAPGSFMHTANQQASNVSYCDSGPFHNVRTKVCKVPTDRRMFAISQQGKGMQALSRNNISALESSTGKHFTNHGHEATLGRTHSMTSGGGGLCTRIPGQDCWQVTSDPPTDPHFNSFSHRTSQNHQIDSEFASRAQYLSSVYSQKNSQPSRKRRSYDVLRFLEELTFGELKALLFAFEVMDRRKRIACANLRAGQVNVSPQQNPAIVQSCPIAAQNTNSASYVNGRNLSSSSSLKYQCTQNRNVGGHSLFPEQSEQQVLPPHVLKHYQCHSSMEQISSSLQGCEEKSFICLDSVGNLYPHTRRGAVGVERNVQDYSFNCLKSPKPFSSGPVDPNYFGPNQQDGAHNHSFQSLDASSTSNMNQTSPPINTSQHDEQRQKDIKALYDMLRTSYGNKMNGNSKRQKLEDSANHVQPASELGQIDINAVQSACDNQSSQKADHQDIWDASADALPNSQNAAAARQFKHDESPPLVKWNASSPVTRLHSRVQRSQSPEASSSPETFDNKKAALLTQSADNTEGPLVSPLRATSVDQEKPVSVPSAMRSPTTKPANTLHWPRCSSQGSSSLPPANNACSPLSPHCARVEPIMESHLTNATSKSFQGNLTLAVRAEEFSGGQEAASRVGVHISNATSNDQEGDASVPPSEGFPEQLVALPIESSKLFSAPSNLVDQAGLQCKASNEVSAGIQTVNGFPSSDIYMTNGNKVSNASPEKVVEELHSIPNSESVLTKESDTLEFILRSLGIIPEDNEGPSVAILTSSSPDVTSPEQNTAPSLSNDPSGPEVKQKLDLTLPSFNAAVSNNKEQVFGTLGLSSTGPKQARGSSDIPFSPGQQTAEVGTPFQEYQSTSAGGKQNPADVNQSSSVYQTNQQARNVQSPVVTRVQRTEEDKLQETELPEVVPCSVASSVLLSFGDTQEVDEKFAHHLTRAPTARHPHADVVIKLERGVASSQGSNPSMSLHTASKLNQSPPSVSRAPALLDGTPLFAQVEQMQGTLSLSAADSDGLLSSPCSTPHVPSARLTPLINPVADPCSVGLVQNCRPASRSEADGSSLERVPAIPARLSSNASDRSVVRNKHHVADGPFVLCRGLRKQPGIKNGTSGSMVTSISMAWSCQGSPIPGSEESSEQPGLFPQAGNVKSSAGAESSPVCVSSSTDSYHPLSVVRGVLASRFTLKCQRPVRGIHALPPSSNGEVMAVGQTSHGGGSLLRKEGCGTVAVSNDADTDLLSGIRISFVFSLSKYWEHWKIINGVHLATDSLVTTGRELVQSIGKASNFSTTQVEHDPHEVNGPIRAGSSLDEGKQRDFITDSPPSQNNVPFVSDPFVQLADTKAFSTVAGHSDNVYQFEVKLNENPGSVKYASKTNTAVSAELSKLPVGSGCSNENPTEVNDTSSGQDETAAALCCFNSKDLMTQNFFSKNEFQNVAELETTTESIFRFWCPSGDGFEQHHEMEKGFDFKSSVEWLHSGLNLYTVARPAESIGNVHAWNAHYLHFGFTATVDRGQRHKERSQPRKLSNWCSATDDIVFEERESELLESILRSHPLLTDEDSNGSWADVTSHNTALETYRPNACLKNSRCQITQQYGGKQLEADNTEMTLPSLRMGSKCMSSNDWCTVLNQDAPYPEDSTQLLNGQASWRKSEPSVADSTEIEMKGVGHQKCETVLSELPNTLSTALTHSPASEVVNETAEVTSLGADWKAFWDCSSSDIDVAHEEMETFATDCSSISAESPLSLCRVGSSPQQ
ncbi:uncharacterized protein LOC132825008 [Hemiscyllium ocellatum]|uniref:uncharacterized protein LOC132825008 n=1 Tax=Hemiscyllium ocellatum TaxID=170820 RepID=UPI002966CAA8|nr:uncharacterized protein LOC132825008 [Hemiscyllium ocellatum]